MASDLEASVAFVFNAMGPFAQRSDVEYAVDSLRTIGGYRGEVFVVTDSPECYKASEGPLALTIVKVEAPQASVSEKLRNPALLRTKYRMMKAQLLDILPPSSPEYLVYMDSDIVTIGPGCVDAYLRENTASWPPEMAIRTRWPDGQQVHVGSFMMRRNHSESLIAAWQDAFSARDVLDRVSFMAAAKALYGATHNDELHIGRLFQGDAFLPPAGEPLPPCFVHISDARCKAFGGAYVNEVLRESHVPMYPDDLCVNDGTWLSRAKLTVERLGMRTSSCAAKVHRLRHPAAAPGEMDAAAGAVALLLFAAAFAAAACLAWTGARTWRARRRGRSL